MSTDRIDLFTPLERDEISRLNRTVPLMMKSNELDLKRKSLLLNQIPTLFTYYSEKSSDDHFLKLISDFLDLFFYYCKAGYYTPREMFPVLVSMKKALSLANQMNKPIFVQFMFGYVRKFFKFALYWLTDTITAQLRESKRSAGKSFARVVEEPYIPIVRHKPEEMGSPKQEGLGLSLSRSFSFSTMISSQPKATTQERNFAEEIDHVAVHPDLPGASFGRFDCLTQPKSSTLSKILIRSTTGRFTRSCPFSKNCTSTVCLGSSS